MTSIADGGAATAPSAQNTETPAAGARESMPTAFTKEALPKPHLERADGKANTMIH